MDPVIYDSIEKFVIDSTTMVARIERVKNIIAALELAAMPTEGQQDGSTVDEYSLDTGQTKIRTKFRNPVELQNAITYWDGYLQKLIARENIGRTGRVVQLRDRKNFN